MPPLSVKQCTRRPVWYGAFVLFWFDQLMVKKKSSQWSAGAKLHRQKRQQKGCLMSLFLACVAGDSHWCTKGTFEQYLVPGWCQVWTLVVILDKCGVVAMEKALTGRASVHLFCHGRLQINNPYGVSYPVQSVAHLFIRKPWNMLDRHCNLKAII